MTLNVTIAGDWFRGFQLLMYCVNVCYSGAKPLLTADSSL